MDYKTFGFSGMRVSAFSLGTWRTFSRNMPQQEAEKILGECYDLGINLFDGAETYGLGECDAMVGKAIKSLGWKRETYAMISKASPTEYGYFTKNPLAQGLSRKKLTESCNNALRRLGLDYLDVFYCHRPWNDTALEDIVISMNALIQQGKIMYWGTSEFSPEQLIRTWEIAREYKMSPPLVEQTGHNMLGRWRMERELPPVFASTGMATMIYRPLMSGILTGKFLDNDAAGRASEEWSNMPDDQKEKVQRLNALAKEMGLTLTQLALGWILKNPNATNIILGASRSGQIAENVTALEALPKMTDEVMEHIETILDNHPAAETVRNAPGQVQSRFTIHNSAQLSEE